jgi:hypothetical protein
VDEMIKLSAKPRHTIQVPSTQGGGGQNFGRFTKSPGQTKMTGDSRTASESKSLLQVGRTGSVTDVPPPPPVR